ncbi:MAG: thiamine-phosphate kinase [Betaproteobacteria bacterium]
MLSEFELIRRYFTHAAPHTRLGVGDDGAVIRVRRGMEVVVSADMLVAGRHFFVDADPRHLGHKALAVNLSDMAAMGARPRWATLVLALPRIEPSWLRGFAGGFMQLARRHGVDLIGGDTTRGPLAICVQIMGEVPAAGALLRGGARVGDEIWLSGHIGDAALALAALKRGLRLSASELAKVQRRLDRPAPRLALGVALRRIARSAIDISDGLCADLGHICERSRVSARVDFERLPISPVMRRYRDSALARAALLAGGDDYELCFTAPPARHRAVLRAASRSGTKVTLIGRIGKGAKRPAVTVVGRDGRPIEVARGGYDHFRR